MTSPPGARRAAAVAYVVGANAAAAVRTSATRTAHSGALIVSGHIDVITHTAHSGALIARAAAAVPHLGGPLVTNL